MQHAGYEKGYAASSVAAGGSLGILIPPSIILVIYGSIAEAARLFAASLAPRSYCSRFFSCLILAKDRVNDKESGPFHLSFGYVR